MISRKIRFITAAAALALIASVAVARTVHTHTPSAAAHATIGKVTTPPSETAPPHRHGVIVCGMANDSDCEKLEMLLPM
jgi:invasion protein IalB